jgi:hypothetical protein
MLYVSTLKVYTDDNYGLHKECYNIANAKELIERDITSGDVLDIKGIGRLEIYSVLAQIDNEGDNPYYHLEIVAGKVRV